MSDLARMSVSIEEPLFDRLEKPVADNGYSNRSEFVRDLVRNYLIEEEWNTNKVLPGTISPVYDHHALGLSEKLTHQQHHFAGTVLATTDMPLASAVPAIGRRYELQVQTTIIRRTAYHTVLANSRAYRDATVLDRLSGHRRYFRFPAFHSGTLRQAGQAHRPGRLR